MGVAAAVVAAAVLTLLAVARSDLEAPRPTLLLRDRAGRFLGELGGEGGLGYWPLDPPPERAVAATLATEDRRFWRHPGVDVLAAGRALRQNLSSGRRVSGASTLAMQVARLQRPGRRTYPRKAMETLTALLLTARHGRRAVLAHYLRIAPYGNRIHGIGYAARRYFDKPAVDLSWAEAAFLAAIPQSPARMNPYDPLGKVRAAERGGRILDRLGAQGVLTEVEHRAARREIRRLRVPPRRSRPEDALHAVLYFQELLSGRERLPGGDPIVDTTLDLEVQREVAWRAWRAVDRWRDRGAGNAAVLVVDRRRWEVVAAVSSTGYFDAEGAGAIDYLRVPRSSGSTLKPFLYALALERGVITPATILDDLERGAGGLTNADERFLGPLLPRVALANSRNVPAARLLARVGLDEGYAFLGDLGLHDRTRPAQHFGLGLAIGGMPVTLAQLVGAYTVLAGDGRLRPLAWWRRQELPPPRRLVSEATARQITLFLADPQARLPTFPRMGFSEYPFAVAVKTGTSSRYRDAWAVAYSSRYLVGVWVGHPDQRPMSRLSGYRAAARLGQEVMEWLHRDLMDGLHDLSFPPPRGHRAERLCAASGRRAAPACPHVLLEWLPPTRAVVETCPIHGYRAVDRRNGLLATPATPRSAVVVRSFADLPPRYAAWAAASGLASPPRRPSPLATGGAVPALGGGGRRPRPAQGYAPRLEITSPTDGLTLLSDPETPAELSTLALRVTVEPPVEQVVWYVDGEAYRAVDHPYSLRWPLAPGEHRFQVRLPFSRRRSAAVRITVD